MKNPTSAERRNDRELVVTRTFDAPARLVFEAWVRPELFKRWWVPASFGLNLLSCEMDVRTGGGYRLVFAGDPEPIAFFGRYLEVAPHSRLSWSNDESPEGAITTVTFEEKDGRTHVTVVDLYPSKEVLDAAIATGSTGGYPEQFEQLDRLLSG
ncbi:MAG: SRPBCC family protein [Pseudomonadota bacterium]|nr:SRPBCC family protein [Pseudomonadota bacterium]